MARALGLRIVVTLHGYDINIHKDWWEAGHGGWRRRYPRQLFRLAREPNVHFIAVSLGWDVLGEFTGSFTVVEEGKYEIGDHNIYGQLGKNDRFDEKKGLDRAGVLTAKLVKEQS